MNRQVIIMCLFIFCLGIMTGSAFAATMEIMTNPGFETGTDAAAPPWYNQASWGACNGGAITATPEEPANSGARLWKMSGADDGTIDCVEVVSTFGAGGGLFKCSAYVRAPTASPTNPVTAQLRIWFGNAANMYIDGFWGAAVMLTSPDWTLIDDASGGVGLLVSAPCTQVIFRVRVTSTDPAMVAYVDDASILTDRHPVTGRVVDDLGNPMADVKVYIDSNNPPATIVAAAATDDDGTYSATVLDDVELYAKAVPGGLYSESNVVTLPATTEPAVASDLVVTKLATVKFTGRVIDATTKLGIAGAAVAANIADGLGINANSVMAIAGSDGSYELEVLDDSVNPIGTYEYYICAGHSLYSPSPAPDQYVDISVGSSPYEMLDIELLKLMPLVDISAANLPAGAVTSWPNAGSLGGRFILWGTNAPLVNAVNGVKAASFTAAPMNLVDDEGTACITAPPSIVGTLATDKPVFTLTAWMYRASLPDDQNDAGFCSWGPFYYAANFQYSGIGWAADHWGSGNMAYDDIAANAPAGTWHHFVFTSDGITEAVFIDGVQNNTADAPIAFLNTESMRLGAANPIVVGAITDNDQWNFWTGRAFVGSIQSLQIYDVAMSAEDIAEIYSASTPPAATTNTITGKIVDDMGTPMDGVNVTLSIAGGRIASFVSGSGGLGAGEYKFDVLAGAYQVDAYAPLYVKTPAGPVTANASAGNVALADIVLVYRQPIALIDISADDPSVAAGTLASWTNNGSLGGSFKPRDGTTTIGVTDGFKAAIFTGSNNMQLRNAYNSLVSLPAANTGNASWTVSTWIRQNAPIPYWSAYFSWAPHGDPANSTASALLCYADGTKGAFYNNGAGDLGWPDGWNGIPAADQWHNITMTYDGLTMSVFTDGVLSNSNTLAAPLSVTTGGSITLGSRSWNLDGSGSGDYFNGAIARVVMFDDALPSDFIATFADSITPIDRYYITVTVTDGANPIPNAIVRYAGSAVAITGADGIAKFGIPDSGQTFEVYADAAGYDASFEKVPTPAAGDMNHTVALVADPAEAAISDTFNSDLGHWEAFTEFGAERPQGGNDAIGNPWPEPTPGMYNTGASGGAALFQFVQHQIAPGVTYPPGDPDPITDGSGIITDITSNTLTDTSKAWGNILGDEFNEWGRAIVINGINKRYPIVSNTNTTVTVDSGYDMLADGVIVNATYKIVDSVHRWWYPGGIKLTNPLPVAIGSVYNFYYKQMTTGNVSTGRWQLIFTDDAGAVKGTLERNDYDPDTAGVYKQFIPAVQYAAPAGATKVIARIGTMEGNPLSEFHTRSGSYSFDDIVIDPVAMPILSGKVTTADGITPISGAAVTITGAAGNIALTTAADGSYFSIVSPNDTYTVTASKLGFITASIQVVIGDISSANNDFALQVPPAQMVSGKVTNQATGLGIAYATVFFSLLPNASAAPNYTAATDPAGDYITPIPGGTWYVCAVAAEYAPSADLSPALNIGSSPVTGVNIALITNGRNIPAMDKLIFSAITDSFTGGGGAATGAWATYMPAGLSLATMGSPTVEDIDGVKWEQNLYSDGDGYRFGDIYAAPIPANGASVVVAVIPVRNAIATSWTSIVDVFYNKLVLGIRNDNGNLIVIRNGNFFDGPEIADGQKTVLSMVVQPTGEFKVWANGVEIMNNTTTSAMTSLVPGNAGYEKNINVGRNNPDGWTVFNGNIGDVFLYKTALTDAQREALQSDLAAKFDIHVPVFTTISGKVTLEDGITPVQGVLVIGGATSPLTDVNGDYTTTAISGSTVWISASKANHVTVFPVDGTYEVAVGDDPITGKDFRMVQFNNITGIVKDVSDNPIYNAVVQFGGNTGPSAITGIDGKYSISGITPGVGELYADAIGYADNTQTIDATPAAYGAFNVDITLTAKNEIGVIKNGGFETVVDGKPADWHDWAGSYMMGYVVGLGDDYISSTNVAGEFVGGSYGAKYTPGSSNYTFLAQHFPVIPGSAYNVYWKMKGDPGITALLAFASFRDESGNNNYGELLHIEGAAPTAWTQLIGLNGQMTRFSIPSDATYMNIILGVYDDFWPASAGKSLYFDDVVVDRVGPDPVTGPVYGVNNKNALTDDKLVGKRVKVWGKVISINDPTSYVISDGYNSGVTIMGSTGHIVDEMVVVTGTVNADRSITP